MIGVLSFAVFVACAQGFPANEHLCDEIQSIDCAAQYKPTENDETVCGSDGTTYQNYCYYSQARCTTPTTHIAYVGACGATTMPTTATTTVMSTVPSATAATVTDTTVVATTATTVATTKDTLQQVFCSSKDQVVCNTDLDPICGSDGNFYLNKCEFSKAACDSPSLIGKGIDFCTGGAGRK